MIVAKISSEDFAHACTVQSVESSSNGLDLRNDNGDTILHVSSSTNVYTLGETGLVSANAADMKAGARLIAWYDVVAMSYPGQANPSKVDVYKRQLLLCPNYNDALSAHITAFINRLTALLIHNNLENKYLYAIIVSGYSGGDLVAQQVLGALSLNKMCIRDSHTSFQPAFRQRASSGPGTGWPGPGGIGPHAAGGPAQ